MSKDSKKKIEQSAPATGADTPATGADTPVTGADTPVTGADKPVTGASEPLRSETISKEIAALLAVEGEKDLAKIEALKVEREEVLFTEALAALDKRKEQITAEITKAVETGDFNAVRDLGANAAIIAAQRTELSNGRSEDKYLETLLGALTGAPESKFIVEFVFDGGKAVAFKKKAAVSSDQKANLRAAETRAHEGAKSNFVASSEPRQAGVSGDPKRHAPPGWTSTYFTKGETWNVKSLGNGHYEFTLGDRCLSGIGNAVVKQLSGHGPNIYAALKLPLTPGDSFLANPPKAWTPPTKA